ncbi:MAG: electron transport complex subunit RsxB [Wenzhouxiangella sp.]|jgi:electron transport complex protein RnfB|nr:electron transport complex subunit RsxB [Wenzhouxiangella sp.]
MLTALTTLVLMVLVISLSLLWLSRRLAPDDDGLVERINAELPQTQCAQCGYPGCRPYAEAIARGEADINQCPPGGEAGVRALARLLGREPKPLDASRGETKPPLVALIDEARCIGCTLCIQACPVDAIVGAARQMHTVLAAECTGCELCLPPCPVDCIDLVEARQPFVWPSPERIPVRIRAA